MKLILFSFLLLFTSPLLLAKLEHGGPCLFGGWPSTLGYGDGGKLVCNRPTGQDIYKDIQKALYISSPILTTPIGPAPNPFFQVLSRCEKSGGFVCNPYAYGLNCLPIKGDGIKTLSERCSQGAKDMSFDDILLYANGNDELKSIFLKGFEQTRSQALELCKKGSEYRTEFEKREGASLAKDCDRIVSKLNQFAKEEGLYDASQLAGESLESILKGDFLTTDLNCDTKAYSKEDPEFEKLTELKNSKDKCVAYPDNADYKNSISNLYDALSQISVECGLSNIRTVPESDSQSDSQSESESDEGDECVGSINLKLAGDNFKAEKRDDKSLGSIALEVSSNKGGPETINLSFPENAQTLSLAYWKKQFFESSENLKNKCGVFKDDDEDSEGREGATPKTAESEDAAPKTAESEDAASRTVESDDGDEPVGSISEDETVDTSKISDEELANVIDDNKNGVLEESELDAYKARLNTEAENSIFANGNPEDIEANLKSRLKNLRPADPVESVSKDGTVKTNQIDDDVLLQADTNSDGILNKAEKESLEKRFNTGAEDGLFVEGNPSEIVENLEQRLSNFRADTSSVSDEDLKAADEDNDGRLSKDEVFKKLNRQGGFLVSGNEGKVVDSLRGRYSILASQGNSTTGSSIVKEPQLASGSKEPEYLTANYFTNDEVLALDSDGDDEFRFKDLTAAMETNEKFRQLVADSSISEDSLKKDLTRRLEALKLAKKKEPAPQRETINNIEEGGSNPDSQEEEYYVNGSGEILRLSKKNGVVLPGAIGKVKNDGQKNESEDLKKYVVLENGKIHPVSKTGISLPQSIGRVKNFDAKKGKVEPSEVSPTASKRDKIFPAKETTDFLKTEDSSK